MPVKYDFHYPLPFGDSFWVKKQWARDIFVEGIRKEIDWCSKNPRKGQAKEDEAFIEGLNQAIYLIEKIVEASEYK